MYGLSYGVACPLARTQALSARGPVTAARDRRRGSSRHRGKTMARSERSEARALVGAKR